MTLVAVWVSSAFSSPPYSINKIIISKKFWIIFPSKVRFLKG